jgi:serine/threonine-protein kinase
MHLSPGQIYGDGYRIVRLLGEGSMGAVYEAENPRIHRRVALKTLHAALSMRPDVVQRFEREAQAAGRIGSPHIVEVLDVGELPDRSRFLVMEMLDGTTLAERIRARGRLHAAEAAPIVHELLSALAAAHHAGIVHRDLKPANVFLMRQHAGRADFVKLLDFGVSKFDVLGQDASMTRTGAVLGTPYYMSPEQAKGSREVDARSDLYAAGVILYECVTGQVPFFAETFNELIFKIVLEAPLPAESFVPDLDPHFAAILRRAMARDAGERFQSALEFQHALGQWLMRSPAAPMPPVEMGPAGQPWSASPLGPGGTMMLDQAPQLPPAAPMHPAAPPMAYGPPPGAQPAVSIPMSAGRARLVAFAVCSGALVAGGVLAAVVLARGGQDEATTAAMSTATAQPVSTDAGPVVATASTGAAALDALDAGAVDPADAAAAASAPVAIQPTPAVRPRSSPAATTPAAPTSAAPTVAPTATGRRISDEL